MEFDWIAWVNQLVEAIYAILAAAGGSVPS